MTGASTRVFVIAALVCVVLLVPATASRADGAPPAVNYVSADAVYLNVGKYAGLRIGSAVTVLRGGKTIAKLEVAHVSSQSASCRVIEQTTPPRVGDRIRFEAVAEVREAQPPILRARETAPQPRRFDPVVNDLRGYLSLSNVWQQDMTGSALSSWQPAVNARIVVKNLAGTGAEFRLRHRSRLFHRSRALSSSSGSNEWSHRLTELAVVYEDPTSFVRMGFGRVFTPDFRGIGYVDGAYVSYQIRPHYRVGVAGGTEPGIADSGFQLNRQRVGTFVTYERGTFGTRRLASTFALSGTYAEGTVSREFGYLQNVINIARRLSVYQSVEIDINRSWRMQAEGHRFSFSNLYFTSNLRLSSFATVDMNYDARKNVRNYNTMDSPDSLFDDDLYRGFGGGLSLKLPANLSVRANGGVRKRDGGDETNRYYSVYAGAIHFPARGHAVSVRYAYSQTPFTTGYRPTFSYRFPTGRRTRVTVSGGGYIYDQAATRSSSYYADIAVHRPLGKRYFVSGSVRQYVGGSLESFEMVTEIGVDL